MIESLLFPGVFPGTRPLDCLPLRHASTDSEGAALPLEAASSARACSAVRGAFLVPVSACCVMRPTCGDEDAACVPQSKARSPATMPLTVGESGTAWRGGNRGMSLVPWRPRESLRKDEIWPTCGGPLGV